MNRVRSLAKKNRLYKNYTHNN